MIAKGVGGRGVSREGNQVNHFPEHRAEVYSEKMSSYLAPLQTLPAVDPDAQLQGHQLVQEAIRVALRNAMPTPPPEAKLLQALHYRCDVHTIMMVPSASYHGSVMDGMYYHRVCDTYLAEQHNSWQVRLYAEMLARLVGGDPAFYHGVANFDNMLLFQLCQNFWLDSRLHHHMHRHHMHSLQHAQT